MPTQADAWNCNWQLAPEDVRASGLTSRSTGGPTTKVMKALFPTLFGDLGARLYAYRNRSVDISMTESERIEASVGEKGELLSYAASCFAIARTAYRDVKGREDEKQDTSLKVTCELLKGPRLSGTALMEAASRAVAAALGIVSVEQATPFTPQSFESAAEDSSFVVGIEEALADAWRQRRMSGPARLPSAFYVVAAFPLDRQGRWRAERDNSEFVEEWAAFGEAIAELDDGNIDSHLRTLGLADQALVADPDGKNERLIPPAVFGGMNEVDVPALDASIQARLGRFHRSVKDSAWTLAQVVEHAVTAAARPMGLSTTRARKVVLIAWAAGESVSDLHHDPVVHSPVDTTPIHDLFRSRYYRALAIARPSRTERRTKREETVSATYAALVWMRVAAREIIDGVPAEPRDIWMTLSHAWSTWTKRTLLDDKGIRSGFSPLVDVADGGSGESGEAIRDRLSVTTREQESIRIETEWISRTIADLFEFAGKEAGRFVRAVSQGGKDRAALEQDYDTLCRLVEQRNPAEYHWTDFVGLVAFIRTHTRSR